MKKLCFGSFASVLSKCKAASVRQNNLIGTLLMCVNEKYDIRTDDTAVTALVRGKNNLSDLVTLYLDDSAPTLPQKFAEKVVPLLDANKMGNIVLAFQDILEENTDIAGTTKVELISDFTKSDLLMRKQFVFADLLAGLFLYVAKYTDNHNVKKQIDGITDTYINAFDNRRGEITFIPSYNLVNEGELLPLAESAHIIELTTEAEGVCPMCGKPLAVNNCGPVPLENGEDIILCFDCGARVRQSDDGKASAAQLKSALQTRIRTLDAVTSNRLVDEVKLLLPKLNELSPKDVSLRMTPLRVDQKVPTGLLNSKIKGYIVDGMYDAVNECIEALAAENKLNVRKFSQSVRHMFEDAAAEGGNQSDVFNALVKYVYAKSGQKSLEACELLISYFVQRCEVFNEITE